MKSIVVLSLFAVSAMAADAVPVPPDLKVCATIKRNPERLACFDRVMAALAEGKDPRAVTTATPEATFGLSANKEVVAPTEDPTRGDIESVSANVKSFGRADDGSLVINLDNGQSWRQIDSRDALLKKSDAVTVRRATLGSFQMLVPSGRAIKVRRVK